MSSKRTIYMLLVIVVATMAGLAGVAAGSLVTVVASISTLPSFFQPSSEGTVSGSGVFISKEGYILTNDETHSFFNALFQYQPGDLVSAGVVRDHQEFEVEVRLGESNSG